MAAKPLNQQIDMGAFVNYLNSADFSNSQYDWLGLALQAAATAEEFVRNVSINFPHEQAEFVAMALANSQPQQEGK